MPVVIWGVVWTATSGKQTRTNLSRQYIKTDRRFINRQDRNDKLVLYCQDAINAMIRKRVSHSPPGLP
jgi:hypothetical protein